MIIALVILTQCSSKTTLAVYRAKKIIKSRMELGDTNTD